VETFIPSFLDSTDFIPFTALFDATVSMNKIELDDSTCAIALETTQYKNDMVNRILILQ
jgi:hypothetical protein